MLFRMKDEKAHQLEAELDKLQADGPAAWAKLPEEELFTPAGFSEERAEATSYSNYSYWGSTFRAFFKNRVAVLLLVALIAVVAFAFLQPYLPGQADPNLCAVDPATGIQYRNIAPGEKGFIWGSNAIGQDLWARIWAGARTSLTIAFFVALIEAVVGITVGVLWGYVRQLDFFFTELYNICDNVPSTIILILISYVASPSVQTLILGMSITGWIAMARFIRNQILIIRDRDYNVASRCIGTPTSRIVVRNLLPYLVSVIMLRMALTIPAAIVLGTAVVATALPLPSSTPATATGTAHVTRAYTDKSTHEPGKEATITAEASTGGDRPLLRQPPRRGGGLGRRHRHERQGHLGLHDSEREQPGIPRHRDRRGRHARGNRHRRLHQLDALPAHGFPLPLQAHRPRGHRRAHHLRVLPLPEAAGLHRQAQPGLPHQRAAVLRLAIPPRAARRHRRPRERVAPVVPQQLRVEENNHRLH